MKHSLAVFDMDGTILNTLDDLKDSLNYALEKNAMPTRSLEEVRRFVGNGIRKLVERGVPAETKGEMLEKVYADFCGYYEQHCADKTRAYEGIPELLKKLRAEGIKTAVVSNKADHAVQILSRQYFEGLFDLAVGERAGARKKPAPDSVNAVLEQLKVNREDAIYIGDSEVDVATAKNAGLDCIAVEWGFRDAEYLKQVGATVIVSKPMDCFELI